MSRRDRDDDDAPERHPALANYSRSGTMVKSTAGKVLKYGAIGGLAGGAILGALTAIGGTALVAMIPVVGPLLAGAGWISGVGAAAVGSAALTGALYGAALGGGAGLIAGASGASDAADEEEERRINNYERGEARAQRMEALDTARERQRIAMARQSRELGISPGRLPRGGGREGAERSI